MESEAESGSEEEPKHSEFEEISDAGDEAERNVNDAGEASKAHEEIVSDFYKINFWPFRSYNLSLVYTAGKVSYKLCNTYYKVNTKTTDINYQQIYSIQKQSQIHFTDNRETTCGELGKLLFLVEVVEAVYAGKWGFGTTCYFLFNIFYIGLRV